MAVEGNNHKPKQQRRTVNTPETGYRRNKHGVFRFCEDNDLIVAADRPEGSRFLRYDIWDWKKEKDVVTIDGTGKAIEFLNQYGFEEVSEQ